MVKIELYIISIYYYKDTNYSINFNKKKHLLIHFFNHFRGRSVSDAHHLIKYILTILYELLHIALRSIRYL